MLVGARPGGARRRSRLRRALAAAPATVLGQGRTPLDVPGALGWGDPQIVLRCGLPGLEPTTNTCLDVNGQGWVIADPDADPVVFTLYGHDPTVEVSVPGVLRPVLGVRGARRPRAGGAGAADERPHLRLTLAR